MIVTVSPNTKAVLVWKERKIFLKEGKNAVPLSVSEEAEISAFCDIKKERAEVAARKYGGNVYTDYREMLEDARPDAVHLCVPHYLHPVIAEYAMRHHCSVLSEKPMAIRLEDAERCVKTAEETGVLYGVIYQCRYNTASRFVKNALESGKLGKIISARSTLTWLRSDHYYDDSDWKGTWDKEGGGVVIDQAIHSIDLANWMIGSDPLYVSAGIANRGHELISVEDSAEGLIRYRNGVDYGFYCMNNYGCDEPIEIRLLCEKGKATFSYDEATIVYDDGRTESVVQGSDDLVYEGGKDYWGFQHRKQIDQFYRALSGKEPLEITGKEALKIQKIVCAIYESGKTDKKIYF